MDWTTIITTAITTLLVPGGLVAVVVKVRKSRAEKVSSNELEAMQLKANEDDKTWLRQEKQLDDLEEKLRQLDERMTALETENEALRVTIRVKDQTIVATEIWSARLVFNVQQAGQSHLIPQPIPVALGTYIPLAPMVPPVAPPTTP